MKSIQHNNQTVSAEPFGKAFVSVVNGHALAETFATPAAALEFGERYAATLPTDYENSWGYVIRYWWRSLKMLLP